MVALPVAITALGAVALLSSSSPSSYSFANTEPSNASLSYTAKPASTDTDGDGIPDWEERLSGTDATVADSATGTSRLTHIESSVDITAALLKNQSRATKLKQQVQKEASQNGELPDPHFQRADIQTSKTSSSSIARYTGQLTSTLLRAQLPTSEQVLGTVRSYLRSNDTSSSTENFRRQLITTVQREQQTAETLATLEVPRQLEGLHLQLINALYLSSSVLKQFTENEAPTDQYITLAQYVHFRDVRSESILSLSEYYGQLLSQRNTENQ
jgi:hypothetical protein